VVGNESPYLAVLVAMHVATALALVAFFWSDWSPAAAPTCRSASSLRTSRPVTLKPFAIYCLAAGLGSLVYLAG
jgi:undecaprenyl pyrophosphate phosphatase UppP